MKEKVTFSEMAVIPKTGYTVLAFKVLTDCYSRFNDLKDKLHDDGTLEVSINVKNGSQRTRNANNYCWRIIGDIARVIETPKEDVYKELIRRVGSFVDIECEEEKVDYITRGWESQGIGWTTERFPSEGGIVTVRFYKGSSSYDKAEMRVFTNHCVEEAKALGIDTMTPEETERMLSGWKVT